MDIQKKKKPGKSIWNISFEIGRDGIHPEFIILDEVYNHKPEKWNKWFIQNTIKGDSKNGI